MRVITIAIALAGLAGATAVIGWFDFAAVGRALLAVRGSGFLAILAVHGAVLAVLGWAWWAVDPSSEQNRVAAFIWARIVRDAAGDILPLSQLGGYVLGARAATLAGRPPAVALASTVVDVSLELVAQIAYTALGFGLLVRLRPDSGLAEPILAGLAVAMAAACGFVAVQQRSPGALERMAARSVGRWLPAAIAGQGLIRQIYARPSRIWLGLALHLLAWLALSAEAWLALRLLGTPLGGGAVIAIESLVYALRSIGFAIPNALGVQEGGYVLIAGLFAISPETALALSLLKRARDITVGVPSLLIWQAMEARRLNQG